MSEEINNINGEFYGTLGPYSFLVTNRKVLSQAWKKVNLFLRNNNWYTDYLNLDYVAFDLENNLEKWSKNYEMNYDKISLIQVPKNNDWYFERESTNSNFDSWQAKIDGDKEFDLRPISNLPIEIQVYTMSILICIAEAVETSQGELLPELNDILNSSFYNYGNRLQSLWIEKEGTRRAIFQAGSSMLYQRYFQNYKLFLKRPNQIAQHYFEGLNSNKKLYVISLDIEKFYDKIDINILILLLKRQLVDYYEDSNSVNDFIGNIGKFFDWNYENEKDNNRVGLPQGLAASGFFANVYLMEFDKKIGEYINKKISYVQESNISNGQIEENSKYVFKKISEDNKLYGNSHLIIRDYCRYVDDLRLVVEIDATVGIGEVETIINQTINNELHTYIREVFVDKNLKIESDLNLNYSKTEIIDFSKGPKRIMSQVLNSHRALASGTPSIDDISSNIDSLKSLFLMVDSKETINQNLSHLKLANIFNYEWDLKEHTIKRFVATELKRNIKIKDAATITNMKSNNQKQLAKRYSINSEKEMVAKLFLKAWSTQPSMIYLLMSAFDIYPSAFLLKSIIEVLKLKFDDKNTLQNEEKARKEKYVAFYIASQLFFKGFLLIKKSCNDNSEINTFLEELAVFAEYIVEVSNKDNLEKSQKFPYYVLQGVTIFLVAMDRGHFKLEYIEENTREKLKKYLIFQDVVSMQKIEFNKKDYKLALNMALIGHQVVLSDERFLSWFIKLLNKIELIDSESLIKLLFFENNRLFRKMFSYEYKERLNNWEELQIPYMHYLKEYRIKDLQLNNGQAISLLKIILSPSNPFNQENALLLLTKTLVELKDSINILDNSSILDISIKCKNWTKIQDPNYYTQDFLEVDIYSKKESSSVFSNLPFWLSPGPEAITYKSNIKNYQYLYRIGRILRSCLIGDFDYTATKFILEGDEGQYFGLKNTTFSRSFGLNNSSKELVNQEHPITPWFREFLFHCLRWPYAHFTLESEIKYKDIRKLINERIEYQRKLFGKMSNLPMYIYPVETDSLLEKSKIKIAIVQTLMPNSKDFDVKNPLYWSEENRIKHRNHLINICNLIERHIKSQNLDESNEQYIDLIVFPELSIHYDDIDLLRRLSNKVKANIFAGLTFMTNPNKSSEMINRAIWLIRQKHSFGEDIIEIFQGKQNVTSNEQSWGIKGYRPYQVVLEFKLKDNLSWRTTGAICYDSTDLKLAADLRDVTDSFIVAALNKDVQTFDNMVSALSYHMYQTVILANTGEFGGSTVQAPFSGYQKLITHLHGNNQVGIAIFDIDASEFKSIKKIPEKMPTKTPPAGYEGRS